jgi:hypothetical protein
LQGLVFGGQGRMGMAPSANTQGHQAKGQGREPKCPRALKREALGGVGKLAGEAKGGMGQARPPPPDCRQRQRPRRGRTLFFAKLLANKGLPLWLDA